MPIYGLFKERAFDPEHLQAMGGAFEEALLQLGLVNRDDPIVKLVAMKIIELGQRGERDPARLRDYAVKAFTSQPG